MNVKHKIYTEANPPICKNLYRLLHAFKPVIEGKIKDMSHKGIIQESDSPRGSPIVIVTKKSRWDSEV